MRISVLQSLSEFLHVKYQYMEKCDFGTTLTLDFMQYMKTRRKQCKTANDLRVRDIREALLFWHIEEQLINHE